MKIAETEFGEIEYTLHGKGPVILILHGGHSNCNETFGLNVLAQNGFSILTPSRPGYQSTPSSVGETAEKSAEAMIGLLDYLKIEQVSVIAISGGGPTGIHLVSRYPHRVKKFILESAVSKTWLTPADTLYKVAKILFSPSWKN